MKQSNYISMMKINPVAWPTTAAEAVIVQNELRHQVRLENDFKKLELIAGVDVSYDLKSNLTKAVVVTMQMGEFKPLQTIVVQVPTTFPYIPGFLSFREIPAILAALKQLIDTPDLLIVDGQGIAHPRRLGIAAHLGVLVDLPTIGVAKSRLCGRYVEPGSAKGDRAPLLDKDEWIGTVLRSKVKTNPLFISPGYRVDQTTAAKIVWQCLTTYRLPEPTRLADNFIITNCSIKNRSVE